ncbi:O-antigen ligase family protein [Deinococcus yunweiensis]|uniref:O-antigen ligase family protein n=1 Tax=Deinococcus yunweiensis TaxID=367282 RepID=UPI00398E45C2
MQNPPKTDFFSQRLISLPDDWLIPAAFILGLLPSGVFVSILLLIVLVIRRKSLEALGGLVLVVLANPAIFKTNGIEVFRYLPLLCGLIFMRPGLKIISVFVAWSLALLATLLLFNGLVVSSLPSISLFKATLFLGVLWVLFNTQRVDFEAFASRLDRFIPLFLLFNIPAYFFHTIGFARNGTGFQGLMNQPQAFGVTAALFATWLLYRMWTRSVFISVPITVLTIIGLLGCILLSGARTSLLGFSVSFIIMWLIQMLRSSKSLGLKILMTIIIGGISLFAFTTNTALTGFLFKNSSAENILDAADTSRGSLVRRSLENFEDHPLLGVGFGTPSLVDAADITYAPIVGLPISVALEKGVWFSATLEEQGVVGTTALLIFFVSLIIYSIHNKTYLGMVLLSFLLASNLGEMTMFSMGGLGLLQWLLVMTGLRIRS